MGMSHEKQSEMPTNLKKIFPHVSVVSTSWATGGGAVQNTPPYARKNCPGAYLGGPLALVPLADLQGLEAVVSGRWRTEAVLCYAK
jgi:hypothetical protein